MIAVDSNLLVYAHREDSPWYDAAYARIAELAEGRAPWAIPWPCIHEFLAIVTHPRIYNPPTPLEEAIDQVEAWLESPTLVVLSESPDYWPLLQTTLVGGRVSGPQAHDARIVTICLQHGGERVVVSRPRLRPLFRSGRSESIGWLKTPFTASCPRLPGPF